jgi:hypothetical protein
MGNQPLPRSAPVRLGTASVTDPDTVLRSLRGIVSAMISNDPDEGG